MTIADFTVRKTWETIARGVLILLLLYLAIAPAIADESSPAAPGSLSSVRYSSTAGEILWTPASSRLHVVGYQLTRDGKSVGFKDARSLFEPYLEPGREYTYTVRAVDQDGNTGEALTVRMSSVIGRENAGSPVSATDQGDQIEGGRVVSEDRAPGSRLSADIESAGDLTLYSSHRRLTLKEGDHAGVSIELSVQRDSQVPHPVTLSLIPAEERDGTDMRHEFSMQTLPENQSGSVLTLWLNVGVAPLLYHERRFQIVADDGQTRVATELVVDVTPTSAPDVYLLIGQSNMEGYSEVGSRERYPGGLDARHERIHQLNVQPNSRHLFSHNGAFADEQANVSSPLFVPAEDPLHEPRFIGIDGKEASFAGLGLTFAKEALKSTTASIYLVPAAWGATGFCANANGELAWNAAPAEESFLGGTLLTERALTRLSITLRETGGILRAILWHQGGADSNNPDCARTYAENLAKLVQRLRREARQDQRGASARGPVANLPFIVATQSRGDDERASFSRFNPYKQQVDAAHRAVASYIPYSDFINNDDLIPPHYPCGQVSCVHFGAAALREQGRRFHAALKRIWAAGNAYQY